MSSNVYRCVVNECDWSIEQEARIPSAAEATIANLDHLKNIHNLRVEERKMDHYAMHPPSDFVATIEQLKEPNDG